MASEVKKQQKMLEKAVEQKFADMGKNIAKIRKSKGYSQNKLAELLGISREHLAKVETAKRGLSLGAMFRLCIKLDIPEKMLFEKPKED